MDTKTIPEDFGAGFLSFNELHQFEESIERAVKHHDFLTVFYVRFMKESDEIAHFFDHVDIMVLKDKLAKTLRLATVANLKHDAVIAHQLKELGKHHQDLAIPKKLFSTWKHSLLEIAELCDPEYDGKLGIIWNKALDVSIRLMLRGYD